MSNSQVCVVILWTVELPLILPAVTGFKLVLNDVKDNSVHKFVLELDLVESHSWKTSDDVACCGQLN